MKNIIKFQHKMKTIKINIDNIGMLRQYINESNEPITNGAILYWLTGDKKYLEQHNKEKENDKKLMKEIVDKIL